MTFLSPYPGRRALRIRLADAGWMERRRLNQGRLRRDAPLCAPAVIGSLALHLVIGGSCLVGGLFRTTPSAPARSPVEPPLVSILLQPPPPLHSLEPMPEWTDPPPTLPDLLERVESPPMVPEPATMSVEPALEPEPVLAETPSADPPTVSTNQTKNPDYWERIRASIAGRVRYPALARQAGLEGTVLLDLTLDETGHLTVLEATGTVHPILKQAALRAARAASPFEAAPPGTNLRAQIPVQFVVQPGTRHGMPNL
ncbi:MAG: TonB family protein [Kiritimatiellia bacterium]|nr:TonB family protein [Kiritimatiellia bacterium]